VNIAVEIVEMFVNIVRHMIVTYASIEAGTETLSLFLGFT